MKVKLYGIPGSQFLPPPPSRTLSQAAAGLPQPFTTWRCPVHLVSPTILVLQILPSSHLHLQLESSVPFQGCALGGGVATLRASP